MILLISTCAEKLHEPEFVKPIEKILSDKKIKYLIRHYSEINEDILKKSDKIIICGTSLKDNEFLKHVKFFRLLNYFNKPILGICAGMQIISVFFGAKIKKQTEIGFYKENFKKDFLSFIGEHEVYHLHNNYTTLPKEFENFTTSKIPQAIKHKQKEIYGVLFHPEVRNRNLIEEFVNK